MKAQEREPHKANEKPTFFKKKEEEKAFKTDVKTDGKFEKSKKPAKIIEKKEQTKTVGLMSGDWDNED